MNISFELAKQIGTPHNLLPQGVLLFVKKYGLKSFEDYAAWRKINKIVTFDQLHEKIIAAVMES